MASGNSDPSRGGGSTGRRFAEFWTTLPGVLTGIAAVIVAVTGLLAATRPFDGDGSADATSSTARVPLSDPAASRATVLTWSTRSGSGTIERPPGGDVPACWAFQGGARLRAGRTLVVGAQRIDPPLDDIYLSSDVRWTGRVGQSNWSAPRHFGSAADHSYRVFFVAITTDALEDILDARGPDGTWVDAELPRVGAEVVKQLDVDQVPGAGDC